MSKISNECVVAQYSGKLEGMVGIHFNGAVGNTHGAYGKQFVEVIIPATLAGKLVEDLIKIDAVMRGVKRGLAEAGFTVEDTVTQDSVQ